MNQLIQKIHIRFTQNKFAAPLLAFAMILLACASVKLEIKTEITDLLEGHSPEVLFYKDNLKTFAKSNSLVAVISKNDGSSWQASDAPRLDEWIRNIEFSSTQIESVLSPLSIRKVKYDEKQARLVFPTLISTRPTTTQEEWNELLSSYWSPFLLGNDQKSLLVDFELQSRASITDIEHLTNIDSNAQNFRVQWTGDAVFRVLSARGLTRMNFLNLVGLAILLALIFILFTNLMACLFALLSVMLGILPIFGLNALFKQPIDLLTSNLFLLLLVTTIEDVFLILYFSAKKKQYIEETLKELLIPCFYTSLTTAVGFGSLAVSEISSVQRFAVWSSLGALNEWLIVFFVVPQLLRGLRSLKVDFAWKKRLSFSITPKTKYVTTLLMIPILLCPFLLHELSFNASPFEILK